jgi:hypothetical protein
MRQAMPAFARARKCVLMGVLSSVGHEDLRGWHDDGGIRRDRQCRQGRN